MTSQDRPSLSRLTARAPAFGRLVAHGFGLLALVFQLLLVTDHLGASAARAFGTGGGAARLGLLEICSGAGVVWMTPDGVTVPAGGSAPSQVPPTPASTCAICSSTAVCGFDLPFPAALPVQLASEITLRDPLPFAIEAEPQARIGAWGNRGPPKA